VLFFEFHPNQNPLTVQYLMQQIERYSSEGKPIVLTFDTSSPMPEFACLVVNSIPLLKQFPCCELHHDFVV
jgi:hypothetical protein